MTSLSPLIELAGRRRGVIARVARLLSQRTGQPVSPQIVGRWLAADPERRAEPGLEIGLVILRVQEELLASDRRENLFKR